MVGMLLAGLGEAVPGGRVRLMRAGHVDVMIITALPDELTAVLALGVGGEAGWKATRDRSGSTYHVREFVNERGKPFVVAAAWSGQAGAEGVALRTERLIEELDPASLAMCGICAGNPEEVSLGDVIVADKIYSFEGPHNPYGGGGRGAPIPRVDIVEHDLGPAWRIDATFIAREVGLRKALDVVRPVSIEAQQRWLLHALYERETNGGHPPREHPDRRLRCPDWAIVVTNLRSTQEIEGAPGSLELSDAGRARVQEELLLYPDGLPPDPPIRVHVGTLVTTTSIVRYPGDLSEIKSRIRRVLGIDMEAAFFAAIARKAERRTVVVKAVAERIGGEKDDRYRAFACRASAECVLALLGKLITPEERPPLPAPTSRRDVFLEQIALRNFKNVHHLEIDFAQPSELPGHWTCIAGLNGAGKSAVLQAIALVLLGDRLAPEIGGAWLARARRTVGGESQSAEIRARVRSGQEIFELALPLDETGINQARLATEPTYQQYMRAFWDGRAKSHLLLSYGAGRNLSAYLDSRHATKSDDVRRQMTLFDPLTQVASVEVLLEQGTRAKPVLTMLKRLLDVVLEDVLSVEETDDGLRFKVGESVVAASELPDGFRATIAWLADLCAAWHEKAPDEAQDGDPSKIRAIVLIDEIDLHLHASLQRVLVPHLRKALPEVQWIVTTHSPLVISSFDRREIVLLEPGPEGPERHELDRQILAFTTDEVYEFLMDVPPHSAALEERFQNGKGDARLAELMAQSPKVSEQQAQEDRAWIEDLARRVREREAKGDPEPNT